MSESPFDRSPDPLAAPLPRAILLLDAAGMAADPAGADHLDLARLVRAVEGRVRGVVRIAYADWAQLPGLREAAAEAGFDQVQIAAADRGGGAVAVRMAVDAMEIAVAAAEVEAVVLMGPQPALLPLVRTLRRKGRRVLAVVPGRAATTPLREHCDGFLVDGPLDGPFDPAAAPTPRDPPPAPTPRPAVLQPTPPAMRPAPAPAPVVRLTASPPAPARPAAPRLTAAPPPPPRGEARPPLTAEPPPSSGGRGRLGRR